MDQELQENALFIHLSDTHFRRSGKNSLQFNMIDHVVNTFGNSIIKPVILVTGDITDSGGEKQFPEAKEGMLLLKKKGFIVLAVPGNHDRARKGVASWKPASRFAMLLCDLYDNPRFEVENDDVARFDVLFPTVTTVTRHDIRRRLVFIGLNSMDSRSTLYLAQGAVSAEQCNNLSSVLDAARDGWAGAEDGATYTYQQFCETALTRSSEKLASIIVIFLHHHPFVRDDKAWLESNPNFTDSVVKAFGRSSVKLNKAALLSETVKDRINVVCFGHQHVEAEWENKWGASFCLASGQNHTSGRYKVIRFFNNELKTETINFSLK